MNLACVTKKSPLLLLYYDTFLFYFHNLAIILGPLYELRLLTKYFMLEKLCSIAPPQALIASYYDNDFRGNWNNYAESDKKLSWTD